MKDIVVHVSRDDLLLFLLALDQYQYNLDLLYDRYVHYDRRRPDGSDFRKDTELDRAELLVTMYQVDRLKSLVLSSIPSCYRER